MTATCITYEPGMVPLGRAVVAIGVFDGVHLGHQDLLETTAEDAQYAGARSVAVTFDRDPDQVVTPESAAPQLLTLEDKCRFISDSGIDVVLVVPFTPVTAALPAEKFLEEVLGTSAEVAAIHVGEDFRFGACAAGDIETLRAWGAERGAAVYGHDLVEIFDEPVTSTRIRSLVATGEVAAAAGLLGRPTRVSGQVHRGRMQGRKLGFPTANVVPVPFAALPADGVYAGYAELANGMRYRAAIAVGTPPSFPEARDYLEAHLLGFSGDLYDQRITLSFAERLRDQRAFGSLGELTRAIEADVAQAAATVPEGEGFAVDSFEGHSEDDFLEDGRPVVDDPAMLAAAEAAAANMERPAHVRGLDWVSVSGQRHVSSLFNEAGVTAALVTSPLEAAGIPYAWEPYEPQDMPAFRIGYGAIDRRFELYVPAERADEARELLGLGRAAVRATIVPGVPAVFDTESPWTLKRVVLTGLGILFLFVLLNLLGN